MKSVKAAAVIHILFLMSISSQVLAVPAAVCPFVQNSSVIGGRLTGNAWKGVSPSREFQVITGDDLAKPSTSFKVCTDGKTLFFEVKMACSDTSKLKTAKGKRDNPAWDEAVEVFISPSLESPSYYHFVVDSGNTQYDNFGGGNAADNNYNWTSKTTINKSGWTAEIAIPLSEIGRRSGIKPGELLAFNVCRDSREGSNFQCWSPTGSSYHNRDAFGVLVAGSYEIAAETLIRDLKRQLQNVRSVLKTAPKELRTRIAVLGEKGERLESRSRQIKRSEEWNDFALAAKSVNKEIKRIAIAQKGLFVWQVNPWQLPWSDFLPSVKTAQVHDIEIVAFQGEYITQALGVANGTSEIVSFRCIANDLLTPCWEKRIPGHIKLYHAVESATKSGGKHRDALPPFNLETCIDLAPGRNSIVWITLDAHGLETGTYSSRILFKPLLDKSKMRVVNVSLRVLPAEFPQGPEPYSNNWATYCLAIANRYPEKCYEDQKEHFTSVHLAGIPGVKFGPDSKPAGAPDFSDLDKLIDVFGNKSMLYLLEGYGFASELGTNGNPTQQQKDNFKWYVGRVRKHFGDKGLGVCNFAWYPQDEPRTLAEANKVADFGKLLQSADPEQQIFSTIFEGTEDEYIKVMGPYINVWCPTLYLSEEKAKLVRSQNGRFFSYSVLNRMTSPYFEYRLSGFKAIRLGYEGIGFWSYNDCGYAKDGTVWDDDAAKYSAYSVIYEGTDGPVSSVRWEAWRQGIQDYRYCKWLTDLANRTTDKSLAAESKTLVARAISDTLGSSDKSVADKYIDRMRETALSLLKSTKEVAADASMDAVSAPICLTSNAGELAENADTSGYYTYSVYPDPTRNGEASLVKNGPIFFKGKNALKPPQSSNKLDGKLTDGGTAWTMDYSIIYNPPPVWTITFDLNGRYKISHAMLTLRETNGVRMSVSETAAEGSWNQVDCAKAIRFGGDLSQGDIILKANGVYARFVRFDLDTLPGRNGVGEVRIFGWR